MMTTEIDRLPALIDRASAALTHARTAAEVLDAKDQATMVYDTAKAAARFARAKNAHGEVLAACHKMQGDALMIEMRAQCRLADEYDAAQARGEVASSHDGRRRSEATAKPTAAHVGINKWSVLAARKVRDAERRIPGMVRKVVEEKLKAGEEPRRADVKRAVSASTGPKPSRRKNNATTEAVAAALVLDAGKSYEQAASETGVGSVQIIKTAVAREQGRREGAVQVDPATLTMSAQQKLDTTVRQHIHKLDVEFEQRVLTECRKRLEETILPSYNKSYAEHQEVIKARKGVMDRATYKKILSCLHPDRVDDAALKKRFEDAFHLFTQMEVVLLDEKQHPTTAMQMPRTYEELMALKQKTSAARKARREHQTVGVK